MDPAYLEEMKGRVLEMGERLSKEELESALNAIYERRPYGFFIALIYIIWYDLGQEVAKDFLSAVSDAAALRDEADKRDREQNEAEGPDAAPAEVEKVDDAQDEAGGPGDVDEMQGDAAHGQEEGQHDAEKIDVVQGQASGHGAVDEVKVDAPQGQASEEVKEKDLGQRFRNYLAAMNQPKKRSAEMSQPPPSKKNKHTDVDVVFAGDWKCGKCGLWNAKFSMYCYTNKDPYEDRHDPDRCSGRFDDENTVFQEDDGHHKIRKGAILKDDWYCGQCRWWNRWCYELCDRCGRHFDNIEPARKDPRNAELKEWVRHYKRY
ncbi:hypothetical protein CC80DRAFT_500561 [Byssothecium circinans]|uniref:RanBP2-type domain-containing protein n=1 Tax=Byssothecium circinans TaxID=147558 RepID=A0A6A5UEE9_9PLEO|nr:hypothetical protein CC80DRAFT_500561 [Byssothecium circinans]